MPHLSNGMESFAELPKNLPIPVDDGACDRLLGQSLPSVFLSSTQGRYVDLSAISGWVVIYCYPMTRQPNIPLPDGWDEIPGARGCTPQSCAFRDRHQELKNLGVQVFGLSSQDSAYQTEATERLHLPYELLSDRDLSFAKSLELPMFEIAGQMLIKRVTLIVKTGRIVKIYYPVFPPDKNVDEVIEWLQNNAI